MSSSRFFLAALLPLLACGGSAKKKTASGVPPATAQVSAQSESAIDSLWALAPRNAVYGVIVAPGATARLHSMVLELIRVVEAGPLGKKMMDELRERSSSVPFDVFDPAAFGSLGIDLELGAALFYRPDETILLVLPVADRGALRKVSSATLETHQGLEVDNFGNHFYCAEAKGAYLCMESVQGLLGQKEAQRAALSESVYRLPQQYRGDVEIIFDMEALERSEGDFGPDFHSVLAEPGLMAAALRLGNGSVSVRGWLQAKPKGPLAAMPSSDGVLAASARELRPSSFMRLSYPVELLGEGEPDQQLPGGFSLKNDVYGNTTGEILVYAPTSTEPWLRVAIGLRDPAPFRSLLSMGCPTAALALGPKQKVTPGENRCDLELSTRAIPGLPPDAMEFLPETLRIAAEVREDQAVLTIGDEQSVSTSGVPSRVGSEILELDWSLGWWTQNFSIIRGLEGSWHQFFKSQPESVRDGIGSVVWMLAHVYEFAAAVSVQDDGIHALLHLGTYAGDPPEAYAAYQEAVRKNLEEGESEAEFAAIARTWPSSMAGKQALSRTGLSRLFATTISKVAVEAFLKYVEAAQQSGTQAP